MLLNCMFFVYIGDSNINLCGDVVDGGAGGGLAGGNAICSGLLTSFGKYDDTLYMTYNYTYISNYFILFEISVSQGGSQTNGGEGEKTQTNEFGHSGTSGRGGNVLTVSLSACFCVHVTFL